MSKLNIFSKKLYTFIKNHLQWLGFLVVLFAVLFSYVTVLFEPKEVLLDIIYLLLFALLLFGMYFELKKQIYKRESIKFKLEEAIAIAVGAFSTYSLVHFFDLNVIIAASSVGLLGFILIKKHDVPLYCGAFAGMVSVSMFSFFEVFILSMVCFIIYTLSKPIFKGYGGKLGTVAFLSSLIIHSIFGDEFLVVQVSFNFYLLILTTTLSVIITYYLQHYINFSPVLSSSLPSLLFSIIFVLFIPNHLDYVIVFFSASFIGMSSKERLPSILSVIISGLVLGIIYDVFIEFFNGLGGKLGLMAMISVIITTALTTIYDKLRIKLRKK